MTSTKLGPRVSFVLLKISLLSILFGVIQIPLLEPDEGRNARVGQEILATGDWVVPHFHGMPYLDKPILYFAAEAASLRAFGSNETAARLPSLLFAIATCVATWLLARRLHSSGTAWASVVVLATSPLFMLFARTVIFDIALTCFVTFAFWFAVEGRAGRRWGFPLFWVSAGLAVLTKGPVGLLLPILGGVLMLVGLGRPWRLRSLFHPIGIALFLATCLPWVLSMESRQPGFLRYALLVETVERLTKPTFQRTGPFYYYVPILLAGLLPWSLVAMGRMPAWLRGWRRLRTPSGERGLLFAALAIVVFFSISSSKLGGYVLPVVPLIAVLMGREIEAAVEMRAGGRPRSAHRAARSAAPLPASRAVPSAVPLPASQAAPSAAPLPVSPIDDVDPSDDDRNAGDDDRSGADGRTRRELRNTPSGAPSRQSRPSSYQRRSFSYQSRPSSSQCGPPSAWTLVPGITLAILGATMLIAVAAGLPLDTWLKQPAALAGAARQLSTGLGIVCTVCGAVLLALRWSRREPWAPVVLALVAPLMLVAATGPMARYGEQNSARQLAAELRKLGADAISVATVRCFPTSIDFYLGRVVPVVTDTGTEITSTYVARNHAALEASGAQGLWTQGELDAVLAGNTPAILVTRTDEAPGPGFEMEARVRKYRIWVRPEPDSR